jgi:hypothetical protein
MAMLADRLPPGDDEDALKSLSPWEPWPSTGRRHNFCLFGMTAALTKLQLILN